MGQAVSPTQSRLFGMLVSFFLVDFVHEFISAGEGDEVHLEEAGELVPEVGNHGGDVRGHDDIVHLPEGVIAGEGLFREDVHAGTGDFFLREGVNEGGFIDDGGAGDIDEEGGFFMRANSFSPKK